MDCYRYIGKKKMIVTKHVDISSRHVVTHALNMYFLSNIAPNSYLNEHAYR